MLCFLTMMYNDHKILLTVAVMVISVIVYLLITRIINAVLPTKYELIKIVNKDGSITYKIVHYGLRLCMSELEYDSDVVAYMKKSVNPGDVNNSIFSVEEWRDEFTVRLVRTRNDSYAYMYITYYNMYHSNYKEETIKVMNDDDIKKLCTIVTSHT